MYMLLHECKNQTMKELMIKRHRLTEFEVKSYTLQILEGLKYLR